MPMVRLGQHNGNIVDVDDNKAQLVTFISKRNVLWDTDTDFNSGTKNNVEVLGVDEAAVVQLSENTDNSDDVPFTTPANYNYNAAEIEVTAGKAQLKSTVTDSNNWPFTTPANYTYDPVKIEVTGGVAKLKGVPEDPYAWYHLNESSGINIPDSSTHGRNGTTVGSPAWVVAKLNNGLQLTGTQYGNLGDIANFERTTPFSIELWLKTADTSGAVFHRRDAASPYAGWDLAMTADKIYFYLCNTSVSNNIAVNTPFVFADDAWHHYVVTYDGSSNAAGVNIYIDGVLKFKSIQYDNLTASTLNPGPCCLGKGVAGFGAMNGTYDEVVIYDRVLLASEVAERYNSGAGTEIMIGAYPLDNPSIYPVTGHVFISNITTFTETSTKPANTEIKYHCSSDDGATWKYWNGSSWVVTDNSYTQANLGSDINSYIDQLAASGTFKARALLNTTDGQITPELDNVYIAIATYPTGGKEIEMDWDIQSAHNFAYLLTTETVSEPPNTDIKYKYSINSGVDYNTSWLTNAELQSALQGVSCVGDGSDKLKIKFQLFTSDANKTCQIDNLNITSDAGYATSGDFESNEYNCNNLSQEWGAISWNVSIPVNTTLIMKCRAGNELGNLGSYSSALINGQQTNVVGKYFQWKAWLAGNGAVTSNINWLNQAYVPGMQYTVPGG